MTGGWAEEWKGTGVGVGAVGGRRAVCENEHNGRNVGAYGRERAVRQKCLSPLAARVEGMCGWPTLYGKSGRRTDHHILIGSPRFTFGPQNVCAPVCGPGKAGGTMWKVKGS